MSGFFLGVDVGSSSSKATVVDGAGRVVGEATSGYSISYPRPGWAEQDPTDWYTAACRSIRAVMDRENFKPSDIEGVAVDGPAHNVALLDDKDEMIRPTLHWSDLRSVSQAERLERNHGELVLRVTYQRCNPSWTLSHLAWIAEQEPETWRQLRRIRVTKDYVRHRLTGDDLTDEYDAIGTQLYDVDDRRWSDQLCQLVGLPSDRLPQVAKATSAAGGVTPQAARDTGLSKGTPVAVGSGDSVVEAFGIGVVATGEGLIKLGTAANVSVALDAAEPSESLITYRHFVDDLWFVIAATNSGAGAMRWFRNAFRFEDESDPSGVGGKFEEVERLVGEVSPGADGLLFLPYLMGERSPIWDPDLRASFIGISANHGAGHFGRAVMEGVGLSIRHCLEAVESKVGTVRDLRLIGGGSRSAIWAQMISDILSRPLSVFAASAASYGSALLAAVSVEGMSVPNPTELLRISPNPESSSSYQQLYGMYNDAREAVTKPSHRLVKFANDISPT